MKFILIDKIKMLKSGEKIETSKNLTLAEEYLGDHFPTFPILPGVLMIEAMTQSAAWMVRDAQDYENTIIYLKSARNVKYSYFQKPGTTMDYTVEMTGIDETTAKFKGTGICDGRKAVSAKLELCWKKLSDRGEFGAEQDENLRKSFKDTYKLLTGTK